MKVVGFTSMLMLMIFACGKSEVRSDFKDDHSPASVLILFPAQYKTLAAPFLLGAAQSLLLMLPPLIKTWMLEFASGGLRATALSILGVTKRLLAVPVTVLVYVFASAKSPSVNADNDDFVFIPMLIITTVCLLVVAISIRQNRDALLPEGVSK